MLKLLVAVCGLHVLLGCEFSKDCDSDTLMEKWECHKHSDCKKMDKCKNKSCGCTEGNLCEYECETAEDCVKNKEPCSTSISSKCKCENNLCRYKELPPQCKTIKDCVAKDKCKSSEACTCASNQCLKAWYMKMDILKKHPTKNCRVPESKHGDCKRHVLDCQENECSCTKPVTLKTKPYIANTWGECAAQK